MIDQFFIRPLDLDNAAEVLDRTVGEFFWYPEEIAVAEDDPQFDLIKPQIRIGWLIHLSEAMSKKEVETICIEIKLKRPVPGTK